MPEGVLQWFDPASGRGAIVRGNRVFATAAADIESGARHPGARVHFDISREAGAERAVSVTLRPGTRVSRRQRRFGTLAGARRADTKGSAPFARPHPEWGRALATRPFEVARAWAQRLQEGDIDAALALYAPDAVLHAADGAALTGRARIRGQLEAIGGLAGKGAPDLRGEGDGVVVAWRRSDGEPGLRFRCRIEHGLLAEQWIDPSPAPPAEAPGAVGAPTVEVSVHGALDDGAVEYARRRLLEVIDDVGEPVLFARMKLTLAADPARQRPALAQVSLDIDGEVVRAHVAGHEMREAADLLEYRLRDKLQHRAEHGRALRRRTGVPEPGGWRHGDLPTARPAHFDRPAEERELLRHKTFALEELTPDEAAFDMDQLDYDFHLFRDLASGMDSLLERSDDGTYRLTRLQPVEVDAGPSAISLTVAESPPATATVGEALARLDDSGERFVFFREAASGRGHVVYRRYDGHYGLITPE